MNLGKLQSKVGVVLLLRKFRFELADEHKTTELELDPYNFGMAPLHGINLKVFAR